MCERNATANASRFEHPPNVIPLDWSDGTAVSDGLAASPDGAGYSLILGSDITYSSNSHASLVAAIARLLLPTNGGIAPSVALVAHATRRLDMWGVDTQLRSFEEAALNCGLQVQRSSLRCEETDSDGYLLRLVL